jgi:hypothetical protein
MSDLNVTNTFVSGTSIVAADMNQNFDDIETLINTTGVPKLQDGAVSAAAKITDGVVTPPKLGMPYIGKLSGASTAVVSSDGNKIVTGAGTQLIETDPTNGIDVDATASKLTVKRTGWYSIVSSLSFGATLPASASATFGYAVNGVATGAAGSVVNPNTTTAISMGFVPGVTLYASLTANDYIQPYIANTSASSTTLVVGLTVEYVGPAS